LGQPTRLQYPQVTADHSHCLKQANSRFFTDCYPISAVFTPKVNQDAARSRARSALASNHEYIINHLISAA
jgi:hypothetical protein